MTRVVLLALREFRANWSRNAIFGAILFISIAVQLFTALSAAASGTAVRTYGTAIFGYAETHVMSVPEPLGAERLARLNHELDAVTRSYPWFRPSTAVDVPGYLRAGDSASSAPLTLRAVSPAWHLLTSSLEDSDEWRTVTGGRRRGAALMLERSTAQRLGMTRPRAVTILVDDPTAHSRTDPSTSSTSSTSSTAASSGDEADPRDPSSATEGAPVADSAGAGQPTHRIAIRDVPVFGTYVEPNKSLAADALVNQDIVALAHARPTTTQVYWRCEPAACRDTVGLVRTASAAAGIRPGADQRIDELDQFQPVLRQQQQDGTRFAVIVLVLGALAVAIVATAFVEVRAPQLATLRSLGASRPAVGAITLMENLFTALLVGVSAIAAGVATTLVDPNRFNQIPQVRVDHLDIPFALYANTAAITVLIGLLTGLAPAVRAYRAVRAT
jgi:putative ABC transport system permease protein